MKISEFKTALVETEKLIGVCLDHIGTRLGLDHDRVLSSHYAIATMVGYLHMHGGKLSGSREWDKLLYWYIHTFLWGRYAGSTESVMAKDLNILEAGDGIDGLIRLLRQNRGDLTLRPEDFWGWSTGARFYPLLYMLTRVGHSKDFGSGVELSNALLGRNSALEIHHIFPKDILYRAGKGKAIVNALANYTFLTKDTNLEVSNREPAEYIPVYLLQTPGAIESHWIPIDSELWKIEKYETFLEQRRILLAQGANAFLDSLCHGNIAEVSIENYSSRTIDTESEGNEEELISEVALWLDTQGLNSGIANYNLTDENGNTLAIVDLAWPQGIQTGLSEALALLIDEGEEVKQIVNQKGYRYFSDIDSFKQFILANYIE